MKTISIMFILAAFVCSTMSSPIDKAEPESPVEINMTPVQIVINPTQTLFCTNSWCHNICVQLGTRTGYCNAQNQCQCTF
ncbi:unnamed protein product [Leptidea sinapis]|uniref:Invertebrate defensins family profile domain-containing protein n=1 Tax=Leptidea sinapis TaxID=189913 RepID=A0A5E4PX68_9NEOP|nr:unnamed protein product [Leptidea sinapis]